jgi:DNA helicase-2/ATP-dependent DNA helicase PcrA
MGFMRENSAISWRCIQSICDLAHLIHEADGHYEPTKSQIRAVPPDFAGHHGIFAVPKSCVAHYVDRYKPIILRWNKACP